MNPGRPLAITLLALLGLGCLPARAQDQQYYTLEDFPRVEKIDAHVHLHGAADGFMAQALRDNFRVLNINVDYPDFPPITGQQADAVSLLQRYPGRAAFAATFSVEGFGTDGLGRACDREHRRRAHSGCRRGEGLEEHRHAAARPRRQLRDAG